MPDDTIKPVEVVPAPAAVLAPEQLPNDPSMIGGVSLRGWIVILFSLTVCVMSFMNREVVEPLHSLAIAAVSYYFGHATGKK